MTKRELWNSMSKETKSFVSAMIKSGLTIRAIKTEKGEWRK